MSQSICCKYGAVAYHNPLCGGIHFMEFILLLMLYTYVTAAKTGHRQKGPQHKNDHRTKVTPKKNGPPLNNTHQGPS